MSIVHRIVQTARLGLVSLGTCGVLLGGAVALPAPVGPTASAYASSLADASLAMRASSAAQPTPPAPFPFDEADCGPPAEEIPGPPPWLIVVGRPMSDSWLMCYIKRDFEGQTFFFDRWGEIRRASFQGYPEEC